MNCSGILRHVSRKFVENHTRERQLLSWSKHSTIVFLVFMCLVIFTFLYNVILLQLNLLSQVFNHWPKNKMKVCSKIASHYNLSVVILSYYDRLKSLSKKQNEPDGSFVPNHTNTLSLKSKTIISQYSTQISKPNGGMIHSLSRDEYYAISAKSTLRKLKDLRTCFVQFYSNRSINLYHTL